MHVWSTELKHVLSLGVILVMCMLVTGCSTSADTLEVGDRASSFQLPTAGEGEVALDDYIGDRPVLLFFHMAVG